jgi:hypothetical protein
LSENINKELHLSLQKGLFPGGSSSPCHITSVSLISCNLVRFCLILFTELIYCGNILDDDATLKACGLKSGVMVHVLKKKEKGLYFHVI